MGLSHAPGVRTAALAAVGAAALLAALLNGNARDGLLLAAAGGFALGIAAALRLGEAGPEGRADVPAAGPLAARADGPRDGPDARVPAAEGLASTAVARATVAAVAHDMSSPLAALKSNLEWLRDALETGRLDGPEEQAEAREVLRDAREAAERLRADVGALRAAGRGDGQPRP